MFNAEMIAFLGYFIILFFIAMIFFAEDRIHGQAIQSDNAHALGAEDFPGGIFVSRDCILRGEMLYCA